jgi:hypothetical protein
VMPPTVTAPSFISTVLPTSDLVNFVKRPASRARYVFKPRYRPPSTSIDALVPLPARRERFSLRNQVRGRLSETTEAAERKPAAGSAFKPRLLRCPLSHSRSRRDRERRRSRGVRMYGLCAVAKGIGRALTRERLERSTGSWLAGSSEDMCGTLLPDSGPRLVVTEWPDSERRP